VVRDCLAVDGYKYWHKATSDDSVTPTPGRWRAPYQRARSVDIEMTAYALLTYVRRRDFTTAASIAKWIVSQRNSRGGFSTTQVMNGHSVSFRSSSARSTRLSSTVLAYATNLFCICDRLNRPYYGSCPSVRPSVCLSVCFVLALNSKTKSRRKPKLTWTLNVPRGMSLGVLIISSKRKMSGLELELRSAVYSWRDDRTLCRHWADDTMFRV